MFNCKHLGVLTVLVCAVVPMCSANASISYKITYSPQRSSTTWEVSVTVAGITSGRAPLKVELPSWGDWTELGESYFSDFTADPAAKVRKADASHYEIRLPRSKGETTLNFHYRLHLRSSSDQQEDQYPILPFCTDSYCHGFSENTLAIASWSGKALHASRTLSFDVPNGWSVATGWRNPGPATEPIELDSNGDNGVISFGKNTRNLLVQADGVEYQITQNGLNEDLTRKTLDLVVKLYSSYMRLMGVSPRKAVRVFLTGSKGWGTNTDHGIHLSVNDARNIQTVDFNKYLAHELFHDWLGNLLTESTGEEMVWLKEGFTDYIACWALVRNGLADEDWFAKHFAWTDGAVRENKLNPTAILGKSDNKWRKFGSGLEDLSYEKGSLIAFHLDVRLWLDKKGSVAGMLRDFLKKPDRAYSQKTIQSWLRDRGFGDFVRDYLLKPDLPDLPTALDRMGYESADIPVSVAYLGIGIEERDKKRIVSGIDPEGPGARAGLRIGDRITGYVVTRLEGVRVSSSVVMSDRFGMELFDPQKPAHLWVLRDKEEEKEIEVAPKSMPGGVMKGYRLPTTRKQLARSFFDRD